MRLLFLTKRHPQQRDLIERPYGRFHHIPVELAARGHDVRVLLCSHRRMGSERLTFSGVDWSSRDFLALGPHRFWREMLDEASGFRPDWVIGCSDAWVGVLAAMLARRVGARLGLDAYDNFEAYMPWNLPLHWAWRRAVGVAHVVTVAGPELADLLQQHRKDDDGVEVVPMAADPAFKPMDRSSCRIELGLPDDRPLIGYSGGWARNRGTGILSHCIELVRSERPDALLVLTGRVPEHVRSQPGVLALGYLPDAQLPLALNAMDVACVITANTSFGRFSHPAKLCEAMACGVPVVATATAPVRWMLRDAGEHLAPVGDARAIASRIIAMLGAGRIDYGQQPSWREGGHTLESALLRRSASESFEDRRVQPRIKSSRS